MANPKQGPGSPYQPPGQQNSGGTSVLKIVMIVFGVLALCCVCCAGIAYYGWEQATGILKQEIVKKAGDSPIVKEKLGEISEAGMSMNLIETGEATNEAGDGNNYIVFDVNGSKNSGKLILVQPNNGKNVDGIGDVILEFEGERFDLKPAAAPAEEDTTGETKEEVGTDAETAAQK